jgi:hypothetical protein
MINKNFYKPSIFWGMNEELDFKNLKTQMNNIKKMNIGSVMIHARLGLKTEYFSDKWFEICVKIISYAKEINLNVWLYDEKGWPSGFGGGACLENNQYPVKYLEFSSSKILDETADIVYDKELKITYNKNNDCYYNIFIKKNETYVDLCNPKATDRFINHTYKAYYERYKEYFGNTIYGIFTDEPQYYRWATPYSDVLCEKWKDFYDYNLFDKLPLLFIDNEESGAFRYDYYNLLSKLFIENYIKRVYEWCDERGILLTGHSVEEMNFALQIMACGSVMPFYQYGHIPGIDWLGNLVGMDISSLQCVSVARQRGLKNTLVEIFAVTGNSLSPKRLRQIYDYLAVDGVNLMVQSIYQYTNKGVRKRDYPIDFGELLPWQDSCNILNEYFENTAHFLEETEEITDILIIHPIKSAFFDYRRDDFSSANYYYDKLMLMLEEMKSYRLSFHFGDEDVMENMAYIDGNLFVVGECKYNKIILPDIKSITKHTFKLLKDFSENGGIIYAYGEKPSFIASQKYLFDIDTLPFNEISKYSEYQIENGKNIKSSLRTDKENRKWLYLVNLSDKEDYDIKINNKTIKMLKSESKKIILSDYKEQEFNTNIEIINDWILEKDYRNTLVIDKVSFSKNNKDFFPTSINDLRKQLFNEKYDGDIYINYCFYSKTKVLDNLFLIIERENYKKILINGNKIELKKENYKDFRFAKIDICKFLIIGENIISVQKNYYQREELYETLNNSNNMESVKNAVYYDSEIENVFLQGNFIVENTVVESSGDFNLYGNQFYINDSVKTINLKNFSNNGFISFFGSLKVENEFFTNEKSLFIKIDSNFAVIKVNINNRFAGKIIFNEILDISKFLEKGNNRIKLELFTTSRNMLGPFHWDKEEEYAAPFHYELSSDKYLMQNFNVDNISLLKKV